MRKLQADAESVVDALILSLEAVFGVRVYEAIGRMLSEEYFGGEMDVRSALIHRPELFEKAFIGLLGDAGEKMLSEIWHSKLNDKFALDSSMTYRKAGDLVKCIYAIKAKAGKIKTNAY